VWLPILGIAIGGVLALGLKEWQVQHGSTVTFAVLLLTAVELRPFPQPEHNLQTPAVYDRMAREVHGSVLELPLDPGNAIALWHSIDRHDRPVTFASILAGASSNRADTPEGLISALSPDPRGMGSGTLNEAEWIAQVTAEYGAERIEEWKRWLLEDAQVRWIVFRRAPDFGTGGKLREEPTWSQRLKDGLKPWYFNDAFAAERLQGARELAADFSDRADRSARARALLSHWFGKPKSRQGSAYTEVWEISPADLVPAAATAAPVPAAAERNEAVAAPAGGQ
jgi:hypothetical protein